MNDAVALTNHTQAHLARGKDALEWSAAIWLSVATLGHWIFVAYILRVYGPILRDGPQALNDSPLPSGHVPGDVLGNAAIIAHVLLAAIIIGGGPLQLIGTIRQRFPRFHRALGRTYLVAATLSAIAGLYMLTTRGSVGGTIGHIGLLVDALLILAFAFLAARHAIARNFAAHRRWAMRLFMVASAVWFYRIGLMGWAMTTGGLGVDFDTFTGPYISFLSFGQYLVPLAFLELYLRAIGTHSRLLRRLAAGAISVATLATAVGIAAATMGLWLPRF